MADTFTLINNIEHLPIPPKNKQTNKQQQPNAASKPTIKKISEVDMTCLYLILEFSGTGEDCFLSYPQILNTYLLSRTKMLVNYFLINFGVTMVAKEPDPTISYFI